jgi:hypothetical protein
MRRGAEPLVQLLAPVVLVIAVGIGSTFVSPSSEIYFLNALVSVAIVVAI